MSRGIAISHIIINIEAYNGAQLICFEFWVCFVRSSTQIDQSDRN